MPYVDREYDTIRNDIDEIGLPGHRPDGQSQSGHCPSKVAQLSRQFCGMLASISSQFHRSSPCMVGGSIDRNLEPGQALYSGDYAYIRAIGLQDRALLDMQFQEGVDDEITQMA